MTKKHLSSPRGFKERELHSKNILEKVQTYPKFHNFMRNYLDKFIMEMITNPTEEEFINIFLKPDSLPINIIPNKTKINKLIKTIKNLFEMIKISMEEFSISDSHKAQINAYLEQYIETLFDIYDLW